MRTTTGTKRSKCKVDGCDNEANRISSRLCEKHYMRVRRHGSTDKKSNVKPGKLEHVGGGYLLLYMPDHPLARGDSPRVYEHRVIYYDRHGEGPFKCYHCGATQTWETMHVDHLDDNPKNNRIDNLACSCPLCNQSRGTAKMTKTARENSEWMIEFRGERLHVKEWADRLGISRNSLKDRIKKWPLERAMTEPKGKCGPKMGLL